MSKTYYENPDTFLFYKSTNEDDEEDFTSFLEETQNKLEMFNLKPKVQINAKDKLRPNTINHCFLIQEQMDISEWRLFGGGIKTKVCIKQVQDINNLVNLIVKNKPIDNELCTIEVV